VIFPTIPDPYPEPIRMRNITDGGIPMASDPIARKKPHVNTYRAVRRALNSMNLSRSSAKEEAFSRVAMLYTILKTILMAMFATIDTGMKITTATPEKWKTSAE
jgi:hypothetical protein